MAKQSSNLDLDAFDSALDQAVSGDRHGLGNRPLELMVQHPGGSMTRRPATGMWLTGEEVCVHYAGFLHQDSQCRVILTTHEDGERISVEGKIESCRLVRGQSHEIVVRLNAKIDPSNFVESASPAATSQDRDRLDLTGNIALIETEEAITHLVEGLIKQTHINLTVLSSLEEAQGKVAWPDLRLLLVGAEKLVDGDATLTAIAEAGYNGPIIAICRHDDETAQAISDNSKVTEKVYNPFMPEQFFELMWAHLDSPAIQEESDAIESAFKQDPAMAELITWYVSHTQNILGMIERSITAGEKDNVKRLCRTISDTASAYGYSPIGEAANQAYRHVLSAEAITPADEPIMQLKTLCGQMR